MTSAPIHQDLSRNQSTLLAGIGLSECYILANILSRETNDRQSWLSSVGMSRSMPATQTKKKARIFVATRNDRSNDPALSQKAPNGVPIARAVVLITVCGTSVWYLLWKLTEHLLAR